MTEREPPAAPAAAGPSAADEYRSLRRAIDPTLASQLESARGRLTPELEKSVAEERVLLDRLVWATELDSCDWGIDYSGGLDTPLPHLSELRDLARLLRADAERSAKDGDGETASEAIAALVRMSGHVGGQATIEGFVAFAILHMAAELAAENAGIFNEAQRERISAELNRIDRDDPFGASAMLAWDEEVSAREGVPGPDAAAFRSAEAKAVAALDRALAALR